MDIETRTHLEEAHRHLDAAIEHHEAGRHQAARYRIGQAQSEIEGALGAAMNSPSAVANATGAMGAQGSAGTTDGSTAPRGADPFINRLIASARAGVRELK